VASVCAIASPAIAQPVPGRAVRIVSPVPAGGTSDLVARIVADSLKDAGLTPVVEGRPGAGGRIAIDALRKSPPDGSTLLLAPIALPVIAPLTLRNPGYDPVKDLVPIGQVSRFEYALAVAVAHPAQTLAEFIAWARAHPQQANYGSPGSGSLPHFLGALLARDSGVALTHVTYRGVTQLESELIGGQIAAGISALSDFLALHRAGRIRILATSGSARSIHLPAVPTFVQQGHATVEAVGWHGVFAPAGTPQAQIDQLSTMLLAALRRRDVRERFVALGLEPTGTTASELARIIAADTARWGPVIRAAGFSTD
jgi:tripartite-type tricarboxylate transporter receptor subunit TctC